MATLTFFAVGCQPDSTVIDAETELQGINRLAAKTGDNRFNAA